MINYYNHFILSYSYGYMLTEGFVMKLQQQKALTSPKIYLYDG